MGDELLGQGTPLSNLSAAIAAVRADWAGAIIYVNEGLAPVVWNRDYAARAITDDPTGHFELPAEVTPESSLHHT